MRAAAYNAARFLKHVHFLPSNRTIMRLRHLFALSLCLLTINSAQPQFLKKLGKELKKTIETELNKNKTDKKTTTERQNGTPENESAAKETPTVKLTGTTFEIVRITPDTKFMQIPKYASVSEMHDGIFSVTREDGRTAFFFEDGTMLFDYIWKKPTGALKGHGQFDNGVCLMQSTEKTGSKYPLAILYRDGRVKMLDPSYTMAQPFVDGLARLLKEESIANRTWVYVNTAGKEVFPALNEKQAPGFGEVKPLRDGLRPHFSYKDGKWGYIDRNGKIVIRPQFKEARTFSEGLAVVCVETNYVKRWGAIDKTGKFVIPATLEGYGKISDCRDGYISWVDWDNGSTVFFDKTGKKVKTYKSATPFLGGYALVKPLDDTSYSSFYTVVNTKFDSIRQSPIKLIDRNDQYPDGLPHGAGVYSISEGGGDPYVMTPDGQIVIRTWNTAENRSSFGHIGPYADNLRAKVDFYITQGAEKRATHFSGFMDEHGQATLIYSSEAQTTISDPGGNLTYIPKPRPLPIEIPADTLIIERPIPVPIPYPITINWLSNDKPLGPTVTEKPKYTVTTAASPPEGGTVTGGGTFEYGDNVTVSASANKGWKLTGIDCNDPTANAENGSVTVNGKNLHFTARFIKKDTIEAVDKTLILAGAHRLVDHDDPEFSIPCTVYIEQDKDKVLASPYGQQTYGFLTAIFDPNQEYNCPIFQKEDIVGNVQTKVFFTPMRISGTMADGATGKSYLIVDGGQFMLGGVNVEMNDPMMGLWLNFIMSYNGNQFATVSDCRYRIEMRDINAETGEFTLGQLERFSPSYGWLPSDDSRLRDKKKKSGFQLIPKADKDAPLPPEFFEGCRLSVSERRNDVLWTPTAQWFESASIFDKACKALGDTMNNLVTDYENFWNNPQ